MERLYFDITNACIDGLLRSSIERQPQAPARDSSNNIPLNDILNNEAISEVTARGQAMLKVILVARLARLLPGLPVRLRNGYIRWIDTFRTGPATMTSHGPVEDFGKALSAEARRYDEFAFTHGWMLLSICANSSAFRDACYHADSQEWDLIQTTIEENARSIEM